jgi:hypothetical protein
MAGIFLIVGFMMQVLTPNETVCIGFISESTLPLNVYIAGTEEEGLRALATLGSLVYLNGPGVSALKKSENYSIVRPEGDLQDPYGNRLFGTYYRQLGAIRIENPGTDAATGIITTICRPIAKGDILLPIKTIAPVTYKGKLTDRSTPFEEGLTSTLLLGQDDLKMLGTGQFGFIGLGSAEGVQPGDHFIVYRPQPSFDPIFLHSTGAGNYASYQRVEGGQYNHRLAKLLENRKLPPRPMGDLIVVDTGNHTATVKIINSLYEIFPGDIVVKR